MILQACHGKGWLRIRQTKYGRESTSLIFITCQTANKNHMFFFPICSPPISVLFVNCEECVNPAILSACKQILTFVLSFHPHCHVFPLKEPHVALREAQASGVCRWTWGVCRKQGAGALCCGQWSLDTGWAVFQHGHCGNRDAWSEGRTVRSHVPATGGVPQ